MFDVVALVTQIVKLINLIIEGQPLEVRRAQALAWWGLWWPVTKSLIRDKEIIASIEASMEVIKAGDK